MKAIHDIGNLVQAASMGSFVFTLTINLLRHAKWSIPNFTLALVIAIGFMLFGHCLASLSDKK